MPTRFYSALLWVVSSLVVLTFLGSTAYSAPPNVIFILVDDLGYGDVGCYGQELIQSPRLDRMAAEGMRFTQFYAGSTVCAPSRCSLMTGQHTGHCSVRGNVPGLLKYDEPTLGTIMQAAEYSTACIGKWGIGHPPPPSDPQDHGFDYFYGYLNMWHAHNSYPEYLWKNGQREQLRNIVNHAKYPRKPEQAEVTGASTNRLDFSGDLFTENALTWLAESKRPFFLYLCYTAPHANCEAPALGAPGIEVPDVGDYADCDWPAAEKAKAALISRTDRDVGRLLDQLDELGIAEETLVFFTSDNGPHKEGGVDPKFFKSSGPLQGIKRDLYEGGIRVPLLVRWKGTIAPGRVSDHVAAFWDVMPTLAEIVKQPVPGDCDGISFLPTLLEKPQPQHEYLYWEFHEQGPKQAVRLGDWKGVRNKSPDGPIELYDLSVDIAEADDVAQQHPQIVDEITKIMTEARSNTENWPLTPESK